MSKIEFYGGLDVGFLYKLLKQRPKSECISHKKMPTYHEHLQFVRSFPYREWWVIAYDGKPAGTMYLTKQDEIGIHLLREYRKKGIEAAAVRWMIKRHPKKNLLVNVALRDKLRQHTMKMLGWKKLQVTYGRR